MLRYEAVDLGMPRGVEEMEVTAASPNLRYIVGFVNTPMAMRTFLWTDGAFRYLTSEDSVAWAVNDSGQVVGATIPDSTTTCAVTWSQGEMKRLFSDDDRSDTQGIRNDGTIFGTRITRTPTGGNSWRAYSRSPDGLITYLDASEPKSNSFFHAANEKGHIAFYLTDEIGSYKKTLLWDGKIAHNLPSPQKGKRSLARGLNNKGIVVGSYFPRSSISLPVLWRNGAPSLIDIPEGFSGEAIGINDQGDIVGNASLQSYTEIPFQSRVHTYTDVTKYREIPFLIHDGTFHNLNVLIINRADIRRTLQISSSGVILAQGYVGKEAHAFLLKPIKTK